MLIARLVLCISLTLFSAWVFFFLKNKAYEIRAYKLLIAGGIIVKAAAVIIIYTFFPDINKGSDAAIYYFPQAQKVLSGQVPYRDFATHYSILFHVLLLPALRVWQSVGAVVLTMFLLETMMILLYLSQHGQSDHADRLRVAFLYSFSPISVYWVDVTGYNGSIIALFAMASLIFAQRKRDSLSIASAFLGFLFSKLLMLLSYPAIVCFERRHWRRRALIAAAAIAGYYVILSLGNIDILHPIGYEMTSTTSGNVWFVLSPLIPDAVIKTSLWSYVPILSFSLVFVPMMVLYVRSKYMGSQNLFNSAVAFIAATNLAFFIFSRKAYTFYMPMAFIFLVHTLVVSRRDARDLIRGFVPMLFLSATTTFEPNLHKIVKDAMLKNLSVQMVGLRIIDVVTIVCYAYLMILCFRASISYVPGARPAEQGSA